MGLLNKAAFLKNLAVAKLFKKNIPLTVIFNLTDRCNLKCSYCYAGYYQRRKDELALERITAIIDELSTMGCRRISFGGGEPLLRQDIEEIIKRVKEKKMECVINSNGYLVKDKINILQKIDVLCLSLDGDQACHDAFRGQGTFCKVIEAIECAARHGIPMHTNTVLHRDNLHSIEFILGLARKYNFLAGFNLVIDYLSADTNSSEFKSSDLEIKEALRRLLRYKKEGGPVLFSGKAFEYTLIWPTYRKEAFFDQAPDFKHTRCFAGKFFCIVDTNGDVFPCPHLIGKKTAINAAKEGFRKAFVNLDQHNCKACYQVYHNELNLLFSLDTSVIFNYIKNSLRIKYHG